MNKLVKSFNRVRSVIDNSTGAIVATIGTGLTVLSGSASAAPLDLSTLTASVDFSSVITAILAVAAIMVGVYVAWKAAKMVVSAVRGL
jgi:hypothetical protein